MAGKTEYKNNWQKENVERVNLTMVKGRKDAVRAAAAVGESVNAYINTAIILRMERDSSGSPPTRPQGAVVVSLPSEAMETAQEAAEAAGEAVPHFIARAISETAEREREISK